jgi:lysophospholipase
MKGTESLAQTQGLTMNEQLRPGRRRGLLLLSCMLLVFPAVSLQAAGMPERQAAVEAFWRNAMTEGEIAGVGGVPLRYLHRKVPAGFGALVIVGGRTEFAEKYAELVYDLKDSGFSLYLYDHRGQGLSGRMLPDRQKGHVASFADYVDDLGIFIDRVVRPGDHRQVILLSHSMGGTISILYAGRYPQKISGLILASPMLAINTRTIPVRLVRALSSLAVLVGQGDAAVIGAGRYHRQLVFDGNDVTSSRKRFERNRQLVAENQLLEIGPPTYRWLSEALAATRQAMAMDTRSLSPVLLLQGERDRMVGKEEQLEFCAGAADCRLVSLPGAKHEVLMEEDAIRERAIAEILGFLAAKER